jgi:hypothetical protein
VEAVAPAEDDVAKPARRRPAPVVQEAEDDALFAAPKVVPTSVVERVLASGVIKEQLTRHRRGAMPAERLAVLLEALHSRGGTATREVVARTLDVPAGRVGSQVTAAQRVLNIDGYPVLSIDGDSVRLDVDLLHTQTGVRR